MRNHALGGFNDPDLEQKKWAPVSNLAPIFYLAVTRLVIEHTTFALWSI